MMHQLNPVYGFLKLAFFLYFLSTAVVFGQRKIVKTIAGSTDPIDGPNLATLFGSAWQIKTRDTLAFISDNDYGAIRLINIKRRTIKTLLTNQPKVAGLALSNTGDSVFFSTNGNMLNMYRRSTGQLFHLDTLPETEIDAIECSRKGQLIIGSGGGHRVLLRNINGTYTVLAGKLGVAGTLDGLDTLARFNKISSLLFSHTEDTIYISDRFNSKIRRLIRSTRQVTSLPVNGLLGPRQLAFTKRKDTLLIANSSGHTIHRYPIKALAGQLWCGAAATLGYVDAALTTSRFNFPMGIARCDSGWLVCDNTNRRIRLISFKGQVKTFAGAGVMSDGPGVLSRFNTPYDIVKHPLKDTIYITDQNNHCIRMMDLRTNIITTVAGNGTSGNVNGIGSVARLNRPTNMAMNTNGDTLFFVEPFANKVKMLLTKTNEVKWFVGSDTAGYVDKPVGKFARFNKPQDLSIHDGYMYIADAFNHKIRRVNLKTSAVTTYAGSTGGFADGTLLAAKFNRPSTLEWVDNRLFIGEDAGLRIRVIHEANGTVKNWAGSGNIGTIDGFGAAARFRGIFKLSYDQVDKRLFVAGYLNEGICRYVQTDTNWVGTFIDSIGFRDGEFNKAKFTGPLGFWVDAANTRILMTDANNQRLREIKWYPNTAPTCTFDTTSISVREEVLFPNIGGVATNVSVGITKGDTLQTYSFSVSGLPPGKIQTASINPNGSLKFQGMHDSTGIVMLKVILKDNGGTGGGGTDTTVYYKKVTIIGVNDGPIIEVRNDTSWNNAPRVFNNFFIKRTPGPNDENLQSIISQSIQVNLPELFSVQPFIDSLKLNYTPLPGAIGVVNAYLTTKDNGGTFASGVDSTITPFTITIADLVGIKSTVLQHLIVVPNPARESFRILNLPADCPKIQLINSLGQLVAEYPVDQSHPQWKIPPHLKGLYLIKSTGSIPGTSSILIQ
ncbi:MAG TPA: hypothetical protein PK509_00770 [Catalimonadaceae bacterium]|nr:hypothetical protein [Catalimonadaceae bacterium]HPI10279.1 hypothetical protein [Catalimonadaceae bacterium]